MYYLGYYLQFLILYNNKNLLLNCHNNFLLTTLSAIFSALQVINHYNRHFCFKHKDLPFKLNK